MTRRASGNSQTWWRRATADCGSPASGAWARRRNSKMPGAITSRRNRCRSKTCASRARTTKAASPLSPNLSPADKPSWRILTAPAGRHSRPAWKKSGGRGGAATRRYGSWPRKPCCGRRRERPSWRRTRIFPPAGITTWRWNPAAPSGWPLQPACFITPRPSGAIHARSSSSIPWFTVLRTTAPAGFGLSPPDNCTRFRAKRTASLRCRNPQRTMRSPFARCFRSRTGPCCWTRLKIRSGSIRIQACSVPASTFGTTSGT